MVQKIDPSELGSGTGQDIGVVVVQPIVVSGIASGSEGQFPVYTGAGSTVAAQTFVASDISNATSLGQSLITASSVGSAQSLLSLSYGSTSGTVTEGNDSRLPPSPSTPGALLYDTGTSWSMVSPGASDQVLQGTGASAPIWTSDPSLTNVIHSDGDVAWVADQSVGGFRLTNLGNAVSGTDALNWNTGDLRYVALSGLTSTFSAGGYSISNLRDPIDPSDASTKAYVDAAASGLSVKPSVALATVLYPAAPLYGIAPYTVTGDVLTITAHGAFPTIDGILLTSASTNPTFLLNCEPDPVYNGIWNLTTTGNAGTSAVAQRISKLDTGASASAAFVFVAGGTVNAGAGFTCISAAGSDIVGTDPLTWTQFSGAGEVLVTDPLDKIGNTISLYLTGSSLEVVSGGLRVSSSVAGTGLMGGGVSPLSVTYGTSVATATEGNDSRLPSTPGVQGSILYDSGSAWTSLGPGLPGYFLQTQGSSLNPIWAQAVDPSTTLTAGTGLSGGGDLSSSRTFSVVYGTISGTSTQGNDSRVVNAVQTTRTVGTSSPLSGGGALSSDLTIGLTLTGSSLEISSGGLRVSSSAAGTGLTGGGASPLSVVYGTSSTSATVGNDNRLPPAPGTQGRILYDSGSVWTALSVGTSGQVLQTQGSSENPQWVTTVLPTRQVLAGTGLSGGGALSSDVTLNVSYGTTSGTSAQGNDTRIVNAVQTSRQILSGTGLSGGGDLSSDRTLTVSYGSSSGTSTQGNDSRLPVIPGTQGRILYDSGSAWVALGVGTSGQVLQTGGPSANPSWGTVVGTTTQVIAGTGLTGGGALSSSVTLNVTYGTTSGTATQGNDTRLPVAPGTQGRILYDNGSSWVALATGTSGYCLQTQGASANPQWAPAVLPTRQVLSGTGLTGGGNLSSDVTLNVAYGTTSTTATVGNDSRVVNAVQNTTSVIAGTGLSGGGALSSSVTLAVAYGNTSTTSVVGNDYRVPVVPGTQGRILYDSGTAWVALATGTSGQVLQTGGASANPSWVSVVFPSRQILAGTGLTGGGTLASDVTLNVAYGTTSGTSTQGNDTRIPVSPGTQGRILYDNGSAWVALATGTSGYCLQLRALDPIHSGHL